MLATSAVLGASGGCSLGGSPPDTSSGELGSGHFTYRCAGLTDPHCVEGEASEFPRAIAVGGVFRLDYETDDGMVGIVGTGSDAVVVGSDGFTATRAGYAVMLARDGQGRVVDLLHLLGRDVAAITIAVDGGDVSTVELAAGERATLRATPRDADSAVLGGSLAYTWATDDATIVEVIAGDRTDTVDLVGVDAGSTVITVTAGGHAEAITINVEEEPSADSEAGGTSSDDGAGVDDSSSGGTT